MSGSKLLAPGKRPLVAKTCRSAANSKTPGTFRKITRGYYTPDCGTCHSRRSKRILNATNRESIAKAGKGRKDLWSRGDTEKLTRWLATGMPTPKIAARLGRSIYAVESKKQRIRAAAILPTVDLPEPDPVDMTKMIQVKRRGITVWVQAS